MTMDSDPGCLKTFKRIRIRNTGCVRDIFVGKGRGEYGQSKEQIGTEFTFSVHRRAGTRTKIMDHLKSPTVVSLRENLILKHRMPSQFKGAADP
jgi:hypothetical protein